MCCFIITAPAVRHFTISYQNYMHLHIHKVHASKAFMLLQVLKFVNKS